MQHRRRRRASGVAAFALLASLLVAMAPTPARGATTECAYLPAVNAGSCRISFAPPPGATGVRVVSSSYPGDPGNVELTAPSLSSSLTKRFTVSLTGTLDVLALEATISRVDLTCLDPKAAQRLYHQGDGVRADGRRVHLFDVKIDNCGRRGVLLAHSAGNELAEVNVGRTGLRFPNASTVPASSYPAIELQDVSDSTVFGVSIGSFSSNGQSGAPTAAGIALTGGSSHNVLASVFVAGNSQELLNGVPTGPAITLADGATRNQVVRTRVRWGAKNAQRVVCGVGTNENLWHHNTFDSPTTSCPLGDTVLQTGGGLDHGDPEEPDPLNPSLRMYSPRVWTACLPSSYQGKFCDNRRPGATTQALNPEDYRGDLGRIVTDPTSFVANVAAHPNRFLPGDVILADTFPTSSADDFWNGFSIPATTPLWLVGNTRTQQGNYLYVVQVRAPAPPDIGPALLPPAVASGVRVQHALAAPPSNAVVIDPQ